MNKIAWSVLLLVTTISGPFACFGAEELPVAYIDYAVNKIQRGYNPEIFTRIDMRLHNRVDARNHAEQIVNGSYNAAYYSDFAIKFLQAIQQYNADTVRQEIAKLGRQREGVAGVMGEFIYLPNTDGKVTYFKDGLPVRVLNERVVNEFGAVSIKNTYDMVYNDARLLAGYEADQYDVRGNKTHITCQDMVYEPGAKWYATLDTNALKNIHSYTTIEVDQAGTRREIQWEAQGYQGHFLLAFEQRMDSLLAGETTHEVSWFRRFNIEYATGQSNRMTGYVEEGEDPHAEGEGIGNYTYRLTRSDITYNHNDQLTGYHEVRYMRPPNDKEGDDPIEKWVKTTTDATLTYQDRPHQFGDDVERDPSLLTGTMITTTTENPDGATRTETAQTTYAYDPLTWKLSDAKSTSTFSGTSVWYTDASGHALTKAPENGTDKYYYKDASGNKVYVSESEVAKGSNIYTGTSETEFVVMDGLPLAKKTVANTNIFRANQDPAQDAPYMIQESAVDYQYELRNNIVRMIKTTETSSSYDPADPSKKGAETITTGYGYDENGNLASVTGSGSGGGYRYDETQRLWLTTNDYTIAVTYEVKLGRAEMIEKTIKDKKEGTDEQ